MCGRFIFDPSKVSFKDFGVTRVRYQPPARFNIAPTSSIAVVRQEDDGEREVLEMRWGLIPTWARLDSRFPLLINARAETVASKPAYRSAFQTRRCIVPATGYYEWHKLPDGSKQPFYFTAKSRKPLAFAAIWEGETVATITTGPNKEAHFVHDRMPVILEPDQLGRWMNPHPLSEQDQRLFLRPLPDGSLDFHPVDRRVGNVRFDDHSLLEPVPGWSQ